jgi:hypothetical protein
MDPAVHGRRPYRGEETMSKPGAMKYASDALVIIMFVVIALAIFDEWQAKRHQPRMPFQINQRIG